METGFDDTLRRVAAAPAVAGAAARLRSLSRRFLVVTLMAVGALCGVLAVAFERYVEWCREILIGRALEVHQPLRTILIVTAFPRLLAPPSMVSRSDARSRL